MDRKVQCPVCRATMNVPDDPPAGMQTCAACGTTMKLPLRRREASVGSDEEKKPT